MFIVYLLELLTWSDDPYTRQVVKDLYNASRNAAQWFMDKSEADGIPGGLVDTYDILDLVAYPYDAYSSAFYLLAMKAAETLAYQMSMYMFVYTFLHTYLWTSVGIIMYIIYTYTLSTSMCESSVYVYPCQTNPSEEVHIVAWKVANCFMNPQKSTALHQFQPLFTKRGISDSAVHGRRLCGIV